MLRPTGPRRQSKPQPSEFEAALRQNAPLLTATNVTVRSGRETQGVLITGRPRIPDADPDREVIWTVDGSAVRFNLSTLLAKPAVARRTALNSTNAVVQWVGGKLCMLARSPHSPSQFLFSVDQAGAYAVAITLSSIDLEPWARRSNASKEGLRDAIGASLVAGAGVNVTGDPDGRKRVAVTNPRPLAGGDPSAAGKLAQPALDPIREWSLKAIQKTDPHVVRMDYDASAKEYRGTFPISADGSVTARLDYVRAGTLDDQGAPHPDAGKFLVTTYPADTSRTHADLFDGASFDALILQVGRTEEDAVTDRKYVLKVVEDTRITTSLALVTKTAEGADPSPLATEPTVYVRINFRLTGGGAVTGWNRDSSKDVDQAESRAARSGLTPGGLAIVPNGVVLIGDRYSGNVYAFKDGRRFSGADITAGIGFSAINGMSYSRSGNKLAITPGGYREPIKVFTLSQPGTAGQKLGAETTDSISGDELVASVPLSLWCMAWHENDESDDDDLWVIDRRGNARVFRGGNHVAGKNVTLPGTEGVYAATFVGDVLIYGGDGSEVYAYNVATGKPVRGLELTGSQVTAGLSGFGLLCAAYDPDAAVLYLGGWSDRLVAFAAARAATAFPDALYDNRTMSKTRLQEEVLDAPAGDEERSFKVMVSEQQPGGASVPRTLTGTQLKYHVGALIATLSPAAGSYSASTLPQVYWDIEAKLPDGFGQVSPNRLHSKMTVPRRLPSTWLGLLVRVKIGGTVVSEVVLPWTAYAAPVAWDQRATGSGVSVYRVPATNDSTVRTVKIVLEREWTGDTDTIYLVGNGETLLANTVFELLAWV